MAFVLTFLLSVMLGVSVVSVASAQNFPSKPIRLVVPYVPGGAVDNVGRLLAQSMSKTLGQPVIAKIGRARVAFIGSRAVATSAPDGHTLLLGAGGPLTISVHFQAEKPYDPFTAFAPISMIAVNEGILIVNPSFPASTFAEFVDAVRKAPGKYSYATSGVAGPTHLGGELRKLLAGLDIWFTFRTAGEAVSAYSA